MRLNDLDINTSSGDRVAPDKAGYPDQLSLDNQFGTAKGGRS